MLRFNLAILKLIIYLFLIMDYAVIAVILAFTGILGTVYAISVLSLSKYKNNQPVKSKSPGLLMMFALSNAIGVILLCFIVILKTLDWIEVNMQFSWMFRLLVCSEAVFVPVIMGTYIIR